MNTKYWVMYVVNGELQLGSGKITEHGTLDSAKKKFHEICASFVDEPTVLTATVVVMDQQKNTPEGCREFISHPEPEE